jgi:hypothetical protein
MTGMQLADQVLLHQVHPAKITADVTAAVISNVLLWKARPRAALAVRILLPVASSLAVLGLADLEALAATARGRYVRAHMPPSAQALRLVGDSVMAAGARRHNPALMLTGAAVIAAGWMHPLWPRSPGRA